MLNCFNNDIKLLSLTQMSHPGVFAASVTEVIRIWWEIFARIKKTACRNVEIWINKRRK